MRQNYLSEQIFEWADIGAAHIRATVFYENVRALVRPGLATNGTIGLPWGSDSTVFRSSGQRMWRGLRPAC